MSRIAAEGSHDATGVASAREGGLLDRLARSLVLRRLAAAPPAAIAFREGRRVHRIGEATDGQAGVEIRVRSPRFWRRLATGGSLGFAESWIEGEWTCENLAAVLGVFAREAARTDGADGGLARLGLALARISHAAASNTRGGSRRNIRAHYDLGNDFFAAFLDETMTYSAGSFATPETTLADAQVAKLEAICRSLGLGPDSHVLEIGTGWGSFALHAAGRYGCRVTTTTISRRQHDLAVRRIEAAGLSDRVQVLLQDYRDLTGTFDAVASIEMIEAVGHRYLPAYFGTIGRRLAPGGRACVQAISMPDDRYEAYRRRSDFIQRWVFPGSCCPSLAAITAAMGRGSDLRITGLEDMGLDYARTLAIWRERFEDRLPEIRAMDCDDRFIRMWRYYLAYCEAGFAARYISVARITMAHTGGPPPADVGGEGRLADTHPSGPVPDAARTRVPIESGPGVPDSVRR